MTTHNRGGRAGTARETVEIIERGWYDAPSGARVDLASGMKACLRETKLFTPADLESLHASDSPSTLPTGSRTTYSVTNETTLQAARRLVVEESLPDVMCLNFASAKNPGGGFLGGSQAQEESLARSSGLYASLLTQPIYYEVNRACQSTLYTDHMIVSRDVPVIRLDNGELDSGELLERPYFVSMLTAPAVNAGALLKKQPDGGDIRATMDRRMKCVLDVARSCRFQHLILGAWGCGVFRNDPQEVATLFADNLLLGARYVNRFASVTFAVLDHSPDQRIIGPFRAEFGGQSS